MVDRVAEAVPPAVYSAAPQGAYVVEGRQRRLLPQRAGTGRRLRVELRGALAELREAVEAGDVRMDLIIGRTPDPSIEADEVVIAATHIDFEDAPGIRACFALIAKAAALPLPDVDVEGIAHALAAQWLASLGVQ